MTEFKGRGIHVVVERRLGLIERVLVVRTKRKAVGVLRRLLKENGVGIDEDILRDESFADGNGFEVKLTDGILVERA